MSCNHPTILAHVNRGSFHCLYGDPKLDNAREMYPHHVGLPLQGDFHLVPVAEGAKSRTGKIVFSIVVGGALLATGIGGALGAFGAATAGFGTTAVFGITYGTIALMGAGLLLGGLSMLLTPTPKMDTAKDDEGKATSFTFSGPIGTLDEGHVVPLIYGEIIAGSATIASDIRNGVTLTGGTGAGGGGTGGAGGSDPGDSDSGIAYDGNEIEYGYVGYGAIRAVYQ